MRHELSINSSDKIIVKDYDSITPRVGISLGGANTSLTAQQVDELITMLQFYRQRLEFEPIPK